MLKKFLLSILVICTALAFTGESHALVLSKETEKVKVEIVPCTDEINPRENIDVLVKFTMRDGWHIFAQNPGDAGLPTKVEWKLPEGYRVENAKWSEYSQFGDDIIKQYGYGDKAYYTATIIPAPDAINAAELRTDISWLACKDECVPEKVDFDFKLPVTNKPVKISKDWIKYSNLDEPGILFIMLMAFIGGLILNFMPCIFPILTIKAISLVQSRYNHRAMRAEAILYTAGVILSFFAIASILIILRKQGENIGWGFQLQSPVFVGIMLAVFIGIFLMLLDVINVRNPFANRVGRISLARRKLNAFVTGFFAVLIASPCTAPFMGIAIGYTLAQPVYVYYPVFLALSIGYALPFTLVGFFPLMLYKILPKPGKWMITLKRIFAIPVFITCVWLVWVLGSQTNIAVSYTNVESGLHWNTYDTDKVAKMVAEGKPVFLDFTAKWCITCLANEKMALNTKSFEKLVKERGIEVFKADWTNNDERITQALALYGRNSIPLYVYYTGKNDEFVVLPQLLTPGIISDYLK